MPPRRPPSYVPPGQTEMGIDEALELAVRMHREDRLDGARTLYQRILQAVPGHTDATERCWACCSTGWAAPTQAWSSCARLRTSRPDVPGYQVNLGNVLARVQPPRRGIAGVAQGVRMAPDSPDIHNNVGAIHRASGAFDDALASYQRAIALDPRHVGPGTTAACCTTRCGDLEAATHAYLTAIDIARPGSHRTSCWA
jgi:tetratricopeptide (TPR) repeat protein